MTESDRRRPTPSEVAGRMGRFPMLAVSAGGLGFLRPASGTWGSLPPPAVAALLVLAGQPGWMIDVCMALLLLIGCVACLRFGQAAEEALGGKDPGAVVADEVAGQAVALLGLPWIAVASWTGMGPAVDGVPAVVVDLAMIAAAFVLFRIFDVLKPPPANGLQRLGGGLGILVDDLVAGAMALVVLQLVVRLAF